MISKHTFTLLDFLLVAEPGLVLLLSCDEVELISSSSSSSSSKFILLDIPSQTTEINKVSVTGRQFSKTHFSFDSILVQQVCWSWGFVDVQPELHLFWAWSPVGPACSVMECSSWPAPRRHPLMKGGPLLRFGSDRPLTGRPCCPSLLSHKNK